MSKIIPLLLIAIIVLQPATAFVPPEWRDAVTNDVTLYIISIRHQAENWAQDNLNYLVGAYTNRYRADQTSLKELKLKMDYIIKKNQIKEPSKVPYCGDCIEVIP